jgi:hypothetical protein
MANYVVPQVLVFQEFTQVANEITEPLRACIVGPHYSLRRHSVVAEKLSALIGEYSPNVLNTYTWQNIPLGSSVDQTYTKVNIDNALLRYFSDGVSAGSLVTNVLNKKNEILVSSKNLVSYTGADGTEYERHADLLRDVRVGDIAKISWEDAVITTANVIGFDHQVIASSRTGSADDNNKATRALACTFSQSAGTTNQVHMNVADPYSWVGLPDGVTNDTYTLEVIQASTDGDATSALIRVTSASGLDDEVVTPAAFDSYTTIGDRGLRVLWVNGGTFGDPGYDYGYGTGGDDFILGQKWTVSIGQAFTAPTATVGGTYTGPTDTVYVVEVSTGGATPKVSVSTTTGIDASGPHTVTASSAITIGKYGITITFNRVPMCKNDKYYVTCVAEAKGAIRTLKLSKNLPADVLATSAVAADNEDLGLELFMKRNIEVPACDPDTGVENWTQDEDAITLNSGIVSYDNEWVDGDGELVSLPVRGGTAYVTHRVLLSLKADEVNTISNISDVVGTLGPAEVDNPLSLAVFKALSNSNGTPVKYMAVATNDLAGYTTVAKALVGRDDVYSIVPLTFDSSVAELFFAHVKELSSPEAGRWRILWLGAEFHTESAIVTDILGTIKDYAPDGVTSYIEVHVDDADFTTAGIVAGDTLRTQYAEDLCGNASYETYTIASVLNDETLLLEAGPDSAISVATKMEVWRSLSKDQLADEIGDTAALYSHRRVRVVWPDPIYSSGVSMASYFAAAALAGLRSGVVPHQGLTNVELAGFDDVRYSYFNADQLNTMAGKGVWIVTKDPNTGDIFSRHQVTTADYENTKQREDSITTNVDSISYFFLRQLAPFIGKANITDTTIALLRTQIESTISTLKVQGFSDSLGGQLLDGVIAKLERHPSLLDRLVVEITLTVPFPLNNIELKLVV